MRRWLARGLGLLALAGGVWALQRTGAVDAALDGVAALGPWAAPAFVLIHAASVVALVPSVAPNLAAGAIFGLRAGLPLSLVGAGLGAVAALGIGRSFAGGWLQERYGDDPRFAALTHLARERGWRIVALARLSPVVPFSIANYAFGATPIRARDYFVASVLGTLPSNAVYVYLGTLAGEVAAWRSPDRARTPAEWALLAAGLAVTVALALYLRQLATRALDRAPEPAPPTSTQAGGDGP